MSAAALVVALACIGACVRRLWIVAQPVLLHPLDVLATPDPVAALAHGGPWEQDLASALTAPAGEVRAALVNEQLTEFDYLVDRWNRVPRVCASISTSLAIVLGMMVLRGGVTTTETIDEAFMWGILREAITVVAFGLVGTAFAIGTHFHARRMRRVWLEAADRMVEALEGR